MSWKDRGKLSPEDIAKIIELAPKMKPAELVKMFCVDRATIHYHLERAKILTWKRRKEIKKKNPIGKSKRKQGRGLNAGKSYKELLAIENEKRKKMGLYEFKTKILH